MKKKIVALAVAAAFTTPAFADNANVTVYGKAFLTFDQASSTAAGAVNHQRVNTNASRFGVKGGEDLGEGLKAIYQFEVEMDADGSTGAGLGKTRNSGVGIGGDFGQVMFGIWDSPLKVAHNKIELFDNTTSWSAIQTIGKSATKDFNTRQKNMVQYWSPKMGGLQAALMYSPDEAPTATLNKSILSMSATFDQDDIYASVAYESRNDVAFAGKTDSAMRAVGKYSLADFWVGGMVESIKTNTSATVSVTGNNVELVGGVKMGPNVISASYAKAGSTAIAPAAANDVTQLSLKYGYNFSKRTELFAAYTSQKTNATTATTKTYLGGGIVHAF
ncbi:MAG: porin [Sideroxydans sp.]|jgi:predicted porin